MLIINIIRAVWRIALDQVIRLAIIILILMLISTGAEANCDSPLRFFKPQSSFSEVVCDLVERDWHDWL